VQRGRQLPGLARLAGLGGVGRADAAQVAQPRKRGVGFPEALAEALDGRCLMLDACLLKSPRASSSSHHNAQAVVAVYVWSHIPRRSRLRNARRALVHLPQCHSL
jgi:hypothetical protein